MFFRMPRILLAGRERPEVLALKHESRILGQWTNPVSGSKGRTKPVLQTAQILSPVPSWRNHMEGWMNVRESYSRALEQGTPRPIQQKLYAFFCLGGNRWCLFSPQTEDSFSVSFRRRLSASLLRRRSNVFPIMSGGRVACSRVLAGFGRGGEFMQP